MARNEGLVRVGRDHDTPAFAVVSIPSVVDDDGIAWPIPQAEALLMTADAGGSNSDRPPTWKMELQRWADDRQPCIHVSHFPQAGT